MVEKSTECQCLVTGQTFSKQEMIRCVWSPEIGKVVPDVGNALQGQECWIHPSSKVIKDARIHSLFDGAFGEVVDASLVTVERIERLLTQRCFGVLQFANKAGALVFGMEKLQDKLAKSAVYVIVQAVDGSEGERRKVQLSAGEIPIITVWMGSELGAVCGRERVVHVAIVERHFAKTFLHEVKRLEILKKVNINN